MSKKIILTILILSSACQKKNEQHRVDWQKGAPAVLLQEIDQQEWSEKSKDETTDATSKIIMTQQSYMGFPIEGSFLKKVYSKEKSSWVLESANSKFFDPPDLKVLRGLSFDENAIVKKIKGLRTEFSTISIVSSDIVLLEKQNQLTPFQKVSYFDRRGEPWTAYADQKNAIEKFVRVGSHFNELTGQSTTQLSNQQTNQQMSIESQIFPFGPKLSALTDVIIEKLNLKPTLSNSDVIVTSEAESKILQLDQSIKFDPKDTRFDQVQTFYYLNKSLNWMKTRFAVLFSTPLEVVVHVGYPERTNTAFYFQNKIRLGSGDDEAYSHIPQDPTIVTHESFHYLIDHISGLPFEGEGGSLNEAFADFLTCLLYERPRLAENAYLKSSFKRTLENDFKLSDRNGGLYHDSLIISGLLWEISKKIGSEKSSALALSLLKKLHRYSSFEDFKTVLNSEIILQIEKSDLESIKAILKKRGFDA